MKFIRISRTRKNIELDCCCGFLYNSDNRDDLPEKHVNKIVKFFDDTYDIFDVYIKIFDKWPEIFQLFTQYDLCQIREKLLIRYGGYQFIHSPRENFIKLLGPSNINYDIIGIHLGLKIIDITISVGVNIPLNMLVSCYKNNIYKIIVPGHITISTNDNKKYWFIKGKSDYLYDLETHTFYELLYTSSCDTKNVLKYIENIVFHDIKIVFS